MEYCVYILYSESKNKIYIGYTSDLISRFRSHNEFGTKDWTRKYRPWKVIYCEIYSEKEKASEREIKLKGGQGRAWIHQKLESEYRRVGFISA